MGAIHQALLALGDGNGGDAAVVGQALLYTGNGGTQSITGASFSPDLVICKLRPGATGNSWPWTDNVRGATLALFSNATSAETTHTDGVTSFDANGFSLGNGALYNTNAANYLALVLQRLAGAFDIVTYTGTGAVRTVPHGLGVVPELIVVKRRNAAGNEWFVYPGPLASPETKFLLLSTNAAVATLSTPWNNTAPTSTEFTLGTAGSLNSNGGLFVAWLFASLNPGCKVGSYTGDGNTNGPVVTTGFKPRFVVIKRTDATGNWAVFDDQRDPTSPHNTFNHLNVAGTTAESVTTNTAGGVDFLSTGFQSIDSAPADINISGATYIYLAIA